jgi:hypothetical protein
MLEMAAAMIPIPMASMMIASARVPQPAFSAVDTAGIVVADISDPSPPIQSSPCGGPTVARGHANPGRCAHVFSSSSVASAPSILTYADMDIY